MELTKEQIVFEKGIRGLKKYDEISQKRELTEKELDQVQNIKRILFEHVSKFAIKEAHAMLAYYNLPNDAYSDIYQEMALMFYDHLLEYNPLLSTPTTFFVRYFKEVARNYILNDVIHMSQYHATNIRKVKSAIVFYNSLGVPYSIDMIANRTGLSHKVVSNTIKLAYNAQYANVDEELNMQSSVQTPEEQLLENEDSNILGKAIKDNLNDTEISLLMMRINMDGSKFMSYEKIAKKTGYSIRYVKTTLNHAVCMLNQDENLIHKFGDRSKCQKERILGNSFQFQDDSTIRLEQQMNDLMDSLSI